MCAIMAGCKSEDDGRESLKLALGLRALPSSVKNVRYGEDAWTDYIVHVYCEVAPSDFAALLSGRGLKKSDYQPAPYRIQPPAYAKKIPAFTAVETYHWSGGGLTDCTLVTNAKHDRVYVVYGAD